MPKYAFTGSEPEDFPSPSIARRLEPGDIVETDEPVEHARLELVTDPKTRKAASVPAIDELKE